MSKAQGIVVRRPEELPELLEAAELLGERDTHLAGKIRVLRVGDQVLVQERDPGSGNVILREFPTQEAAEAFVEDRLETYDRMWDGCGCKVDYYR